MREKIRNLLEDGYNVYIGDSTITATLAAISEGCEPVYQKLGMYGTWYDVSAESYASSLGNRRTLYTAAPVVASEPVAWRKVSIITKRVTGLSLTREVECCSEILEPLFTTPQPQQPDELEARIAELQARVEKLLTDRVTHVVEIAKLQARLAAAEFDLNHTRDLLEIAEKGAARYQEAKANPNFTICKLFMGVEWDSISNEDEVLDAAIAAGKE